MKRRIFIAVDLPGELKTKISEMIKQWHWLPIRWLKPENWHITLVPPVYLEDHEVELLKALLQKRRFGQRPTLSFRRVILAPPGAPARMIWLEGKTPPELGKLEKKLERRWVEEARLPPPKHESREPHLHVTIARFKPGEFRQLESKTRVLGEVDLGFEVKEIAIMESQLKPTGAEYSTIYAIPYGV